MFKFAILFHYPGADATEFEEGYTVFLAMVERIPDIYRRQVVHVNGSPDGQSRFYRVLELYFEDRTTMTAALNSEAGQRAGAALYEVFRPKGYAFDTFFADVYEETGGATPTEPKVEPE